MNQVLHDKLNDTAVARLDGDGWKPTLERRLLASVWRVAQAYRIVKPKGLLRARFRVAWSMSISRRCPSPSLGVRRYPTVFPPGHEGWSAAGLLEPFNFRST